MFLRLGFLIGAIALCFAHGGSCDEGDQPLADWPQGSPYAETLPVAAPFVAPLSGPLPLSPARLMSQKPLAFSRTSSFGVKGGREIIQEQAPLIQEQIIEAPTKGGLQRSYSTKSLPVVQETQQILEPLRSYPTKSLPVVQESQQIVETPLRSYPTKSLPVVQESQQIVETPLRSYPTKSLPVQEQVIQETVRAPLPVKGLPPVQEILPEPVVQQEQVIAPIRHYPTKGLPVVQEQQTIVEPIRSYPVKGQQVQETLPERTFPVKGVAPVVQEQAPIQETIVREEVQAPLATKGGLVGGESRFFAETVAAPALIAAAPVQSYGARALNLASNADSVLATGINFQFSCENMPYGYYADQLNNCQVYHICKPIINNGVSLMQRFSFFCPSGTFFDQIKHVCMSGAAADLTPCHLASQYFTHTVSRFAAPATYFTSNQMMPAASVMRSSISLGGKGVALPARKSLASPVELRQETFVQQEVALPEQQELLPVQEYQQFETAKA